MLSRKKCITYEIVLYKSVDVRVKKLTESYVFKNAYIWFIAKDLLIKKVDKIPEFCLITLRVVVFNKFIITS